MSNSTTKTIELHLYGIVLSIDYDDQNRPIAGCIRSTGLHTEYNDPEDELYNVAMDAIESIVLAHAMAEVDVCSKGYIEGLETAVNNCASNL